MKVQLQVWRQSGVSAPPHLQLYSIDAESNWSVLDCLEAVSRREDPSLSYRDNCFSAVCGDCGLRANGREILACANGVSKFPADADGVIHIELRPLRNHPVIRDLAVDRDRFFDRQTAVCAFFAISGYHEFVEGAAMQAAQSVTTCLSCGICDSACEAYTVRADFFGPAALAWTLRFAQDPREEALAQRRSVLDSPRGLSGCVDCGACSDVCPEAIPIHEMIRAAR
jgi:succinate dehydrogenase/fumarate reductase iron-sulfur protein